MDNRVAISQIVVALAEYYDKNLSRTQIAMYVEDLLDMNPEDLIRAVKLYRQDGKNDRFPYPAKLRAFADPTCDPDSEAIEAVSRIVEAIARIGPYRGEEARVAIGELGWLVVQREGGWQAVCSLLNDENMGTLKAQWRQLAVSQYRRAKIGIVGAPQIPNQDGESIGIDLKKLLPSLPK